MSLITLSNASRSITLNHIINYRISKKTVTSIYKVPARTIPLVEAGGRVTEPKQVILGAKLTISACQVIRDMESDRQQIDILDSHNNTYENYNMSTLDLTYNIGSTNLPWIVNMVFLASSD